MIRRMVYPSDFSQRLFGRWGHVILFLGLFFMGWTLMGPFSLSTAFAERIYLNRVVRDLMGFDEHEIEIEGEVIGDIMARRKGFWLNIDDGSDSIGVWVPRHLMPEIEYAGSYDSKGDILMIRGIFNRACPSHGGETDIHALEIRSIRSGYPVSHPISDKKRQWSLILVCLVMGIIGLYWWKNRISE
ncbi:MAG: hypothetical protein ACMUIM_00805 [bacterium]